MWIHVNGGFSPWLCVVALIIMRRICVPLYAVNLWGLNFFDRCVPTKTRKIVRGEPLVDGEALLIHIIDTKKIQKVVICQSLKLFLSPPYVPEEGYFRILVFWHWVTSFQCITCNPGFLTCFHHLILDDPYKIDGFVFYFSSILQWRISTSARKQISTFTQVA